VAYFFGPPCILKKMFGLHYFKNRCISILGLHAVYKASLYYIGLYYYLELLEYQLVGLVSAFELIAISSSETASMHFTSFTDCE